jgi:outer membrane protein assembly factor BamB
MRTAATGLDRLCSPEVSMRLFLSTALTLSLAAVAAADPPYRVLAQDKGHVALVGKDGKVEWEVECKYNSHDIHLLPNGNLLLHTGPATVTEMTPAKEVVWRYEAKPAGANKGRVEVHAFQRLPDGTTMVAESGNRRIVEVARDGTVVREVRLRVSRPDAHRDTRMVRKLGNGNYLVCHEGDGLVREYDPLGKTVWEYTLDLGGRKESPGHGPEGHGTSVFGAIRLANGNTVIAGGNNNRVLEVDPTGLVVWTLDQKELPGITLAWVTTLHALPNGNLIVGNCHAGPDQPQLFEVTRDKKVVWTFRNQQVFGNSLAAAHVLDIPGVIR